MSDKSSYIEAIMEAVGGLVDAGALPSYVDESLHYNSIDEESDDYCLNIQLATIGEDAVNAELDLIEEDGKLKCIIEVFDYIQKDDYSLTLPGLVDYLQEHPSFNYTKYEDKTDTVYYYSVTIPTEYAMAVYVAIVLTIQTYISKDKEIVS